MTKNNEKLSEYCPKCKKVVPAILNITGVNWTIHCSMCNELIGEGNIHDISFIKLKNKIK